MRQTKGRYQFLFTAILTLTLISAVTAIPAKAQAFGNLSENGTAAFMGIGTVPLKILHVSGTGPGTVPLFQRGSDSAGFIIERTPTNRWVLGVNESPTLGNGFVLSTIPTGTQSVPRLMINQDGEVGIGTTSPDAKLHVQTSGGPAVYGKNTTFNTEGWLAHPSGGVVGVAPYPYYAGAFNGRVYFAGAIQLKVAYAYEDYYLNASTPVSVIVVQASTNMHVYLPPVEDVGDGRIYTIKRMDNGPAYTVTVDAYHNYDLTVQDYIDWTTSHTLHPNNAEFITIVSDATYSPKRWLVVADNDANP